MGLTGEQLLEVFAAYNQQIWPVQILAYILAIGAVMLAFKKVRWGSPLILAVLAFFWLWVALLFWLPSTAQGFTIGYAFLALFLIEGLLLLYQTIKLKITFGTSKQVYTIAGLVMVFYTMIGYPLIGLLIGHRYPYTALIGLFPCPLALFTFGMLLLSGSIIPISLLLIPSFWGLSAVMWISIGIWEDIGLLLGSIVGVYLILQRNKKLRGDDRVSEAWSLNLHGKVG